MRIKSIILDKDPEAISIICDYLANFSNIEIVAKIDDPDMARDIIISEKIDLLFIEISLPKPNGFTYLEGLETNPLVVITTENKEYAVKSYELDILDYLIKPIRFERFLRTINKIFQKVYINHTTRDHQLTERPHIFLKTDKKLVKVNLYELCFIESIRDYIKVTTIKEEFMVHKTLSSITEELPHMNFMRIHRSYTVALNKIESVEGNLVEIGGKKIPIGRNYVKEVKSRIFQNHQKT